MIETYLIDNQIVNLNLRRHKKTRLPIGKRVRTHYENTLKTYQEFKFVMAVTYLVDNFQTNIVSLNWIAKRLF